MEAKDVVKKIEKLSEKLDDMVDNEGIFGFVKEFEKFKSDFDDLVGELSEEGIVFDPAPETT